ncbi:hypothetical protein AXW84_06855 [Hymenobacter sp. PAMC 26628]|nr:hypothetical protein AXW84_06855 [Hymenobacter sp. PAMC 26628]
MSDFIARIKQALTCIFSKFSQIIRQVTRTHSDYRNTDVSPTFIMLKWDFYIRNKSITSRANFHII